MSTTAPDGRSWLEWAADYHAQQAKEHRELEATCVYKHDKLMAADQAVQHEAMAQACREAQVI